MRFIPRKANQKRQALSIHILSCLLMIAMFSCSSEKNPCNKLPQYGPKPNIILISIDTLRADHLSCYGYDRETSPNIDGFSENAVIFRNAVTQAPHTAPAHMSIFTALTPVAHDVKNHEELGDYRRLRDNIPTLTEILKSNGYMTVGLTGGGNVSGDLGFDRGFDLYAERAINWKNVYENPAALNPIRSWIASSKESGRPLFLFLHNHLCHDPYVRAPENFRLRFLDKRVDGLPVGPKDISIGKGFNAKRESFWKNVDFNNPDHMNHIISLYDGGILYMDYTFGEVMKLLREENAYDNSIIILLSDHGEEFYEHQTYLHGYLFVETMHVPLIIKFPHGGCEGSEIENQVRTMDLMPTLLDFLEIETPHFMQGVSFMPLLGKRGKYKPLIVSYDGYLKNIRFYEKGYYYSNQPSPGGIEWLFDKSSDPRETLNLAGAEPRVLDKMRAKSRELMASDRIVYDKYGEEESKMLRANKETIEQLKALGYLQ